MPTGPQAVKTVLTTALLSVSLRPILETCRFPFGAPYHRFAYTMWESVSSFVGCLSGRYDSSC